MTDTEAKIYNIATMLFANHGYHAVSMADLVDATHISRGGIYHHISSKEDLLYQIVVTYMQRLVTGATRIAAVNAPAIDTVEALGRALIRVVFRYHNAFIICFREIHQLGDARRVEVLDWHRRYENIWRATMIRGKEEGSIRALSNREIKGLLGMYYYTYTWVKVDDPANAGWIARDLNNVVVHAIRSS